VTQRQTRALRGTAAAWTATVIAATAHTLAGGGAPPPLLIVVVGLLASPFAVALVGRRPSSWRIALVVAASQALFHGAFVLASSATGAPPLAVHAHGATMVAGPAHSMVSALPEPPMLLGHVIAAAATTLALVHGERMLRAVGRGIHRLLARTVSGAAPAPAPRRVRPVPSSRTRSPRSTPLTALSRRGPPAFVSATL
jgi:hypothetical protein